MREIVIIVGSRSDLPQCRAGLMFLQSKSDQLKVTEVHVASLHRNTEEVLDLLVKLASRTNLDAIIVGAGWANHLTGTCDAYLRYQLCNDTVAVIGVAFADDVNSRHTEAALLSITEVPGTQVVYSYNGDLFIGSDGFLRACQFAVEGELPQIKLKEPKPTMQFTLDEAIYEFKQ